jgi:hypothetical protein
VWNDFQRTPHALVQGSKPEVTHVERVRACLPDSEDSARRSGGLDDESECPAVCAAVSTYEQQLTAYGAAIAVAAADALLQGASRAIRARQFHDAFAKLMAFSPRAPLYAMWQLDPVELYIVNEEIF